MGIVPQFWKWEKNVILSPKKAFLFFPKIMACESNSALEYDIVWDNALTYILMHILYFEVTLILTATNRLNNVPLLRFCPIHKTNFVPLRYLAIHLTECKHLILESTF